MSQQTTLENNPGQTARPTSDFAGTWDDFADKYVESDVSKVPQVLRRVSVIATSEERCIDGDRPIEDSVIELAKSFIRSLCAYVYKGTKQIKIPSVGARSSGSIIATWKNQDSVVMVHFGPTAGRIAVAIDDGVNTPSHEVCEFPQAMALVLLWPTLPH